MKFPMMIRSCLLTVSFVFCLYEFSFATTYYVSLSGNDTNAGTQSQPFKTLNKAVAILTPGDTLLVMPGTYTEALNEVIPGGTDALDSVTVKAFDSSNRPILQPPAGTDFPLYIGQQNSDLHDIVVDGLIVDGKNMNSRGTTVVVLGQHIQLKNSEIKNGFNSGVAVVPNGITKTPGDYNQLINLDIHDIVNGDYPPASGILINGSHTLIQGCTIHDNNGAGVYLREDISGQWPIQNNTVAKSQIYNNRSYTASGTLQGAFGVYVFSGSNDLVYDNLIYGNQGSGVICLGIAGAISGDKILNNTINGNNLTSESIGINVGFCSNMIIANNDITNHLGIGVTLPNSPGSLAENNLVYGNNGGSIVDYGNVATLSGNLLGVDPLYSMTSSFLGVTRRSFGISTVFKRPLCGVVGG
jgi:hypothetical protein